MKIKPVSNFQSASTLKVNALDTTQVYEAVHATNQPDWKAKGKIFVKCDGGDILLVSGEYEVVEDSPMNDVSRLPSGRITTKACEYYTRDINENFAAMGIDTRFEVSPRNGYCAVDVYRESIRSDKSHGGWSAVDSNLQCGTPRECCESMRDRYYAEVDAHNAANESE